MKYLRRSLKYFVQISLLLAVILAVLMLSGMVSKDITVAFRHGWTSVGYILLLFAAMSAAYPFFGYGKRKIHATGDPAAFRDAIVRAMEGRGYVLASEKDGELRFHLGSGFNRAARFWEDTISIKPVLGGFEAEGLVRDLARVVMAIENKINNYGN